MNGRVRRMDRRIQLQTDRERAAAIGLAVEPGVPARQAHRAELLLRWAGISGGQGLSNGAPSIMEELEVMLPG